MKIKSIVITGFAVGMILFANHPSFNCDAVSTNSPEGFICSSDRLMDLDREMATVYHKAMASTPDKRKLRLEQRQWIKQRNRCRQTRNTMKCMVQMYLWRLQKIKERYPFFDHTVAESTPDSTSDNPYAFERKFKSNGIVFYVQATNHGSLNRLVVTVVKRDGVRRVLRREIDGVVTGAEVADLNRDGSPEIYVYVTSAGSGAYGDVLGWNAEPFLPIALQPIDPNDPAVRGHMGHDRFGIVHNQFIRQFPVYRDSDPNCCPTGGMRKLEYRLVPGASVWKLQLIRIKRR